MSIKKINWIDTLKRYVDGKPQRPAQEIDNQTDTLFLGYFQEANKKEKESDPSFKDVPKFFQKSLQPENLLSARIRQKARIHFLQHQNSEVLEQEDFELLHQVLRQHISPPHDNKERLNYSAFLTVAQKLPLKFRHFFGATTFLRFDRDQKGRIDMHSFYHYVLKKNNLFQTLIHISLYYTSGNDYLTETNLQEYISDLIPSFFHLKNMDERFKDKYVISAVRRFFFFLDPKRMGRIYVKDLIYSTILAQLNELRQQRFSEEDLSQNWFSLQISTSLYRRFCKLDVDRRGALKKQDLSKYSKVLSDFLFDRIFEQYPTKNGRIDYKGFVQFVLVMENKISQQAIHYFWRLLDVYHKGAIDSFIINMFFRSIIQKLVAMGKKEYKVENVIDEIFDMAEPQQPMAITFNDLIKCKQADIIILMLIDAKVFYDYVERQSGDTLQYYDNY